MQCWVGNHNLGVKLFSHNAAARSGTMETPVAKVVSVADVVSTNADFAASALLALEVNNDFLLEIRQEEKEPIAAINEKQKVIQLQSSERLPAALDRILGSLQNRFRKSKGGSARRKIKEGKTRITLQEGDIVNVANVQQQLVQTEVRRTNLQNPHNNTQTIKVALTKVSEQRALEEEALEFLLENEEREKKELQRALRVTQNKGKAYHEVQFLTTVACRNTNIPA